MRSNREVQDETENPEAWCVLYILGCVEARYANSIYTLYLDSLISNVLKSIRCGLGYREDFCLFRKVWRRQWCASDQAQVSPQCVH